MKRSGFTEGQRSGSCASRCPVFRCESSGELLLISLWPRLEDLHCLECHCGRRSIAGRRFSGGGRSRSVIGEAVGQIPGLLARFQRPPLRLAYFRPFSNLFTGPESSRPGAWKPREWLNRPQACRARNTLRGSAQSWFPRSPQDWEQPVDGSSPGAARETAGCVSSVESLYRRYARWLRERLAHRFGADIAEDLVQKTYLGLLPVPEGRIDHPRAFLLKAATNHGVSEVRRRLRHDQRVEDLTITTPEHAEPIQISSEILREAVLSLPQPLRDVFVLSRFGGLSYAEIAGQLGMPVKTVEWRMSKALLHCSQQIMPAAEDPS